MCCTCTLTGQANGTIRWHVPPVTGLGPQGPSQPEPARRMTFVPDEDHSVKRWNRKFAVFLPLARLPTNVPNHISTGFCHELGPHGGVDVELDPALDPNVNNNRPAQWDAVLLRDAALSGKKITVRVTRTVAVTAAGTEQALALTSVTILAE